MVLPERTRVWRLRQNWRSEGRVPARDMAGSWRLIRRSSLSFQHDTPVRWQIEDADVLSKVHDKRLWWGSEREDFTPCKQRTSSSRVRERGERERKRRREKMEGVTEKWDWEVIFG